MGAESKLDGRIKPESERSNALESPPHGACQGFEPSERGILIHEDGSLPLARFLTGGRWLRYRFGEITQAHLCATSAPQDKPNISWGTILRILDSGSDLFDHFRYVRPC